MVLDSVARMTMHLSPFAILTNYVSSPWLNLPQNVGRDSPVITTYQLRTNLKAGKLCSLALR